MNLSKKQVLFRDFTNILPQHVRLAQVVFTKIPQYIRRRAAKAPERFVTTHAAKHQQSWWAAEGKNSATGTLAARRLTYPEIKETLKLLLQGF